jgi:ubiquinone/menaquinone biosynthesis C-methylase UbiE
MGVDNRMTVGADRDSLLKSAQAEDWRERAQIRLERAVLIERHWGAITARMLALAGLKYGDRVLDVGTGHGEPALAAARVVGTEGQVVGIDLSPEMIEVARRRADLVHERGVEWIVQDAEQLDLPPETFDVALSRNSMMFLPHPDQAVHRIRDALVPDGRFVLAVVGPESTQPQWTLTVTAIADALGVAQPAPGRVGQPGVYSLSDGSVLAKLLSDAGFTGVVVEASQLVYDFSSPDEVVSWHSINPTIMNLFAGQSDENRQRAWSAVVAAAAARGDPDGHVRIASTILYAYGTRPH